MLSVQPSRPPVGAPATLRVAGMPRAASAALSRRYSRRVNPGMSPSDALPWVSGHAGSVGDPASLLALVGLDQFHELLHERRIVVPRPRGDEIPVDDHRPVDILRPALLGIEGALGDRRDGPAADHTGGADDLDPLADDG